MLLDWGTEEGGYVVPIVLDGDFRQSTVSVPVAFQLPCEDVKLLVVGVLFESGPPFQAVNDQTQAYLSILHAHTHVLLEECTKTLPAQLLPLLVQSLHKLLDALFIQLQEVAIGRVEEPVLGVFVDLEGDQQHPVIGDGQHEAHCQGLLVFMGPEVGDDAVEFSTFVLGEQQVLILELPGEGVELEVGVLAEDREAGEALQANFIVSSLEVPVNDVLLPPRPLIPQAVLLLHFQ